MSNLYPREAWRVAGGSISALLLLTFFLYQQPVLYLIDNWNQLERGDYGHGYLVLLISVYLIYYNREKLAALTPCPEFRGISAIVFSSMIWMLAALTGIVILQVVGLLLLVLSIVWTMLGIQITRVLVFPVLYIGFAIPVWFPLPPLLQELTADAVFWLVRIIEIPALRIENMIVLPVGTLSVEEACAGLRYMLAALTLGSLYGYLNYVKFHSRLIIVLVSAGAAMLANILRVFIVVYLAYKTDMQHPYVHDHILLGWYLFGGLIVVLLVIEALLHRNFLHDDGSTSVDAVHEPSRCDKRKSQFSAVVLVAAAFVSAGPVIVYRVNNQQESEAYQGQTKLPPATGEWSYMEAEKDGWAPRYRGAISHEWFFHDKNDNEISLYLGVYPTQRQGAELINELNRISDDKIWRTRYQRAKPYAVGGHQVLEQLLEKNDGTRILVWYWYHVAGQDTVNKYQAKALQVLGLLNGKQQASIIAIATRLDGEPEQVREVLAKFATEMRPSLSRVVDDDS